MSVATRKSDTHRERFYHIPIDNHPKVCAATVFMREVIEGNEKVWKASVAFCSVHDAFVRKIGRQVARRRYFTRTPHALKFDCGVGDPNFDMAKSIAEEAIDEYL